MMLIILQYIEYRCAEPYGVNGDELDAAPRAIKTARHIIGLKTDESNNDVKIGTMSALSCVPAIILLNGALHHYVLKTIYFHLQKAKDKLLSMHQRALMSQKIWSLINEPKRDKLEKQYAKLDKVGVGYTRAQVLKTTDEPGQRAAYNYIRWRNLNKFKHMPDITKVHETEVVDPDTIAPIGNKYPHLRPPPVHPDDQASDIEVEDESPDSQTTREDSPPTVNVDKGEPPNPSEETKTQVHGKRGLFPLLFGSSNALQKKQGNARALQLQRLPRV